MMPSLYLLQNNSAGYCGDYPLFWCEGGGYSPDIDQAKRWTEDEALMQIASTRGSHFWMMWKEEDCLNAVVRVVNSEKLPKGKQR